MKIGVVIGRFQPYHYGHKRLIDRAVAENELVVVVIGSAFQKRSAKNPWRWDERARFIQMTHPTAPIVYMPMRDFPDNEQWASVVICSVPSVPGDVVTLYGHRKDESSFYLDLFKPWKLVEVEQELVISATEIREILFNPPDDDKKAMARLETLDRHIPPKSYQMLGVWCVTHAKEFDQIMKEYSK